MSGSESIVLTVAGSDSCCGAGIQSDLRTFDAFGVRGVCAVSALTAQNPSEILDVHVPPADVVSAQIAAVVEYYDIKAAKTGMLPTAEIIEVVASALEGASFPLVVDPVMVSSSGRRLMDVSAVSALTGSLLPVADWVTPNIPEAEALLGAEIADLDAMRSAAAEIAEKWSISCVLKGGHCSFSGDSVVEVVALSDGRVFELESERVVGLEVEASHGTGCAFSAALSAELAKGSDPAKAAEAAKKHVFRVVSGSRRKDQTP